MFLSNFQVIEDRKKNECIELQENYRMWADWMLNYGEEYVA